MGEGGRVLVEAGGRTLVVLLFEESAKEEDAVGTWAFLPPPKKLDMDSGFFALGGGLLLPFLVVHPPLRPPSAAVACAHRFPQRYYWNSESGGVFQRGGGKNV